MFILFQIQCVVDVGTEITMQYILLTFGIPTRSNIFNILINTLTFSTYV